jgi:hypothetical protein
VMEAQRSTQPTRSVMGMLTVPTRLYPWALMLVLQARESPPLHCAAVGEQLSTVSDCSRLQ